MLKGHNRCLKLRKSPQVIVSGRILVNLVPLGGGVVVVVVVIKA